MDLYNNNNMQAAGSAHASLTQRQSSLPLFRKRKSRSGAARGAAGARGQDQRKGDEAEGKLEEEGGESAEGEGCET